MVFTCFFTNENMEPLQGEILVRTVDAQWRALETVDEAAESLTALGNMWILVRDAASGQQQLVSVAHIAFVEEANQEEFYGLQTLRAGAQDTDFHSGKGR